FRNSAGKWVNAPLTEKGDRCRIPSPYLYGKVNGEEVRLCTNRTAAEVMLADLIREAEGAAVGLPTRKRIPLAELTEAFAAEMRTRPRGKRKRLPSAAHVEKTIRHVRRVLDGCRFVFASDITLQAVQDFLAGLGVDPERPVLPAGKTHWTRKELA